MDDELFVGSVLEELAGDTETQDILDKEIEDETDAEEEILGEPGGISDSDAIDLVAGLNDPNDPDYIDIYAL